MEMIMKKQRLRKIKNLTGDYKSEVTFGERVKRERKETKREKSWGKWREGKLIVEAKRNGTNSREEK